MSRSKLAEAFLTAVCDNFAKHGAEAIERMHQADPVAYLRLVAAVIPKHVAINNGSELNTLTDEELEARIGELNKQIAAARADEVKG